MILCHFILIFSFFASLATNICKLEKVPASAKIFIQAFGYIGGFFFFLVLPLKRGFSGSIKLLFTFAIIYVVVKTLIAIIVYDENGGKEKKNQHKEKSSGATKSKPANVKPTPAKPQKSKKMKDEEYTSLFSSKSDK